MSSLWAAGINHGATPCALGQSHFLGARRGAKMSSPELCDRSRSCWPQARLARPPQAWTHQCIGYSLLPKTSQAWSWSSIILTQKSCHWFSWICLAWSDMIWIIFAPSMVWASILTLIDRESISDWNQSASKVLLGCWSRDTFWWLDYVTLLLICVFTEIS